MLRLTLGAGSCRFATLCLTLLDVDIVAIAGDVIDFSPITILPRDPAAVLSITGVALDVVNSVAAVRLEPQGACTATPAGAVNGTVAVNLVSNNPSSTEFTVVVASSLLEAGEYAVCVLFAADENYVRVGGQTLLVRALPRCRRRARCCAELVPS